MLMQTEDVHRRYSVWLSIIADLAYLRRVAEELGISDYDPHMETWEILRDSVMHELTEFYALYLDLCQGQFCHKLMGAMLIAWHDFEEEAEGENDQALIGAYLESVRANMSCIYALCRRNTALRAQQGRPRTLPEPKTLEDFQEEITLLSLIIPRSGVTIQH